MELSYNHSIWIIPCCPSIAPTRVVFACGSTYGLPTTYCGFCIEKKIKSAVVVPPMKIDYRRLSLKGSTYKYRAIFTSMFVIFPSMETNFR